MTLPAMHRHFCKISFFHRSRAFSAGFLDIWMLREGGSDCELVKKALSAIYT